MSQLTSDEACTMPATPKLNTNACQNLQTVPIIGKPPYQPPQTRPARMPMMHNIQSSSRASGYAGSRGSFVSSRNNCRLNLPLKFHKASSGTSGAKPVHLSPHRPIILVPTTHLYNSIYILISYIHSFIIALCRHKAQAGFMVATLIFKFKQRDKNKQAFPARARKQRENMLNLNTPLRTIQAILAIVAIALNSYGTSTLPQNIPAQRLTSPPQ